MKQLYRNIFFHKQYPEIKITVRAFRMLLLAAHCSLLPAISNAATDTLGRVMESEVKVINSSIALSNASFKPTHDVTVAIGLFTITGQSNDPAIQFELVNNSDYNDNHFFYIANNQLYLKSTNGLSGQATFRIIVNVVGGNEETKKEFKIIKTPYQPESQIKIVNAFSPDNDGINDTWLTPDLRYYDLVQIEVYDRAGNRLFYTKDPEKGWDGRNKSGQVVPGAYFYMVRIDDLQVVLRGVLTVSRK